MDSHGAVYGKGVWFDEDGVPILPGGSKRNKEARLLLQYNSDGTVTKYPYRDWTMKKELEHEYKVLKNDRRFAIPYIPSKRMTISIDKASPTRNTAGATFSENVLDSIAMNAQKAGLPFSTALGMAAQESTIGQGERGVGKSMQPWNRMLHVNPSRGSWGGTANAAAMQEYYANEGKSISYDNVYSPSLLISNWKQRDESPVHDYYYNSRGTLLDAPKNDGFYSEGINATRVEANKYRLKGESPLEHGFRKYRADPSGWNPKDKHYPEKVEARALELTKYSPEIRAYMRKHNLKADGGELDAPRQWDYLTMAEKSEVMAAAVRNGLVSLKEIRDRWNEFANGSGMVEQAMPIPAKPASPEPVSTWMGYLLPAMEVKARYPYEHRVVDTMNNSDAKFMQRLRNNDRGSIQNPDGSYSTHMFGSADNIMFPFVQDVNGQLVDYRPMPWETSMEVAPVAQIFRPLTYVDRCQISQPSAERTGLCPEGFNSSE